MRRFPERDDLRLALARVALLLGNPSLAREAVAPVAADSEQHALALVIRAQAELNLGDLERALETLAEAEKLYPDRPEARLVRIATLLSEHRQDEARAAIEETRAALTGEEEEQAEVRHRLDVTLAQIQAQQGEAEAAIAALTAMVETDPADVLAWQALIQILTRAAARRGGAGPSRGRAPGGRAPARPLPPGGAGSRLARERGRGRGGAPHLRGALGVGGRVPPSGEPPLRPGRRRGDDARARRGDRPLPRRAHAAAAAHRGAARSRSAATMPAPISGASATPPSTEIPRSSTCGPVSSWRKATPRRAADRLRELAPRLDRARHPVLARPRAGGERRPRGRPPPLRPRPAARPRLDRARRSPHRAGAAPRRLARGGGPRAAAGPTRAPSAWRDGPLSSTPSRASGEGEAAEEVARQASSGSPTGPSRICCWRRRSARRGRPTRRWPHSTQAESASATSRAGRRAHPHPRHGRARG